MVSRLENQADEIEEFASRKTASWFRYLSSGTGLKQIFKMSFIAAAVGVIAGLGIAAVGALLAETGAATISALTFAGYGAGIGAAIGASTTALVSLGAIIATRPANDARGCYFIPENDPKVENGIALRQVGECTPQDRAKDAYASIQSIADKNPTVRIINPSGITDEGTLAEYYAQRSKMS